MEFHLKQRAILGDDSEMSFMEMSEISGVPCCDIMQVYDTAIKKFQDQWKTTK